MSVVFRKRGDGNLTASIRTDADGVVDVELLEGRWLCSCGAATACAHTKAVGAALVPTGGERR